MIEKVRYIWKDRIWCKFSLKKQLQIYNTPPVIIILSESLDFALYSHKVVSLLQSEAVPHEGVHSQAKTSDLVGDILQESGDGGDTSSVFSTLTQLKLLWFGNFFCLPYRITRFWLEEYR